MKVIYKENILKNNDYFWPRNERDTLEISHECPFLVQAYLCFQNKVFIILI